MAAPGLLLWFLLKKAIRYPRLAGLRPSTRHSAKEAFSSVVMPIKKLSSTNEVRRAAVIANVQAEKLSRQDATAAQKQQCIRI